MQELSLKDIMKMAHDGGDKKLYVRIRDVVGLIKRRVRVFKHEQVKEKYIQNPDEKNPKFQIECEKSVSRRVFDCEGTFHQWGMNYEEVEGMEGYTAGNYTVAIVEMPDGTIKSVPAEEVEFIS